LSPNSGLFQCRVAWLLATCPDLELRDATQAVECARKGVDANTTAGQPLHGPLRVLGVALYRAKDWQGAVATLEKANQLHNGGDSATWFFLAMANWRCGEQEQARQWFDRAIHAMKDRKVPPNPVERDELDRFRAEAEALIKRAKR
jgi:Flp pilus assembly protein TadD